MVRCYFEDYKPTLAMVGLQFIYAGLSLMGKPALAQGLSPRVSIVYRQALATLALAPISYFSKGRNSSQVLGKKLFSLLFLAAFIGVTLNENFNLLGLYFVPASLATAMNNLVPAITFLMAAPLGLEKVCLRSSRSIAKIGGTIVCVGGAITMTLFKGPKLLQTMLKIPIPSYNFQSPVGKDWFMGCLFLFGDCCCRSFWIILQVPINKNCSDPIFVSAWTCFLAFLQSAIVAFFLEPDSRAWILDSNFQILYCVYAAIFGSGVATCLRNWCISRRGPLFTAMFNPLSTVIATILSFIILHEELHVGSLAGAASVVVGLYIVLWGKAEEVPTKRDQSPGKDDHKTDLEEPLLVDRRRDIEGNNPKD